MSSNIFGSVNQTASWCQIGCNGAETFCSFAQIPLESVKDRCNTLCQTAFKYLSPISPFDSNRTRSFMDTVKQMTPNDDQLNELRAVVREKSKKALLYLLDNNKNFVDGSVNLAAGTVFGYFALNFGVSTVQQLNHSINEFSERHYISGSTALIRAAVYGAGCFTLGSLAVGSFQEFADNAEKFVEPTMSCPLPPKPPACPKLECPKPVERGYFASLICG